MRPNCQPNADFSRPLLGRVRPHAIDADEGEHQSKHPQNGRETCAELEYQQFVQRVALSLAIALTLEWFHGVGYR